MTTWWLGAGAALALGCVSAAAAYEVPARSTAVRAALMDAMRPGAELIYGPPVEFVVDDLRVAGSVAFASVRAQRPGGRAIVLERTPGFRSGILEADMDWMMMQALLRLEGKSWVRAVTVVMPSEAWWLDPALCPEFGAVVPSGCR